MAPLSESNNKLTVVIGGDCCIFNKNTAIVCSQKTQGGYPGFQTDGDDRRISLGLTISILGFFWVLDLSRDFLGIQNNLKIHGSARVSQPRSSAWDFWGLIFAPGIFLGFVGSPRDFLGFWFLPRHVKSGVPPDIRISWLGVLLRKEWFVHLLEFIQFSVVLKGSLMQIWVSFQNRKMFVC